MRVDVDEEDDVPTMEHSLLTTFCEDVLGKLSMRDLRLLANEYNIPAKNLSRQAIVAALMMALRSGKQLLSRFISYILKSVLVISATRGVATAGMETVSRAIGGFAGPIGWIVLSIWTAYDIASPAYRVCVPAVLQIASMRLEQKALPVHQAC